MVRAAIFNLSVTLLTPLADLADSCNASVHYTWCAPIDQAVRARDAASVLCIALWAMHGGDSIVRSMAVVLVLCIALGAMRDGEPIVRARDTAFGMIILFGAMMGGAWYGACCVV